MLNNNNSLFYLVMIANFVYNTLCLASYLRPLSTLCVYALDQFIFYENFAREYTETLDSSLTSTPKVNSDCKFIIESLEDLDAKSNSEWAPTMTQEMREEGVNQLAVF
jgi:hypothetical protein